MSTLVRYGFQPSSLADFVNRYFDNFDSENEISEPAITSWPMVDILEEKNSYILKADLPGVDKKDVSVNIKKGVLYIEGEKRTEQKHEKDKYNYYERSYGKFKRYFALPEETDSEKVEAEMKHGVLTITIPKAEETKTKRIEVKF